eukprot:6044204-Ditylum_brightwellii.AAC.1
MGAYHSVLSINNELSSVDQVKAIVIQASIASGSCPKILRQTHSSTKGGPHHELFLVNEVKMKMTTNQNKVINHLNSHNTNDTSSQ